MEGGTLYGEGSLCIAMVASSHHPLITGEPNLVQPDTQGQITIAVKNCSPVDLELQCNDFIGPSSESFSQPEAITTAHLCRYEEGRHHQDGAGLLGPSTMSPTRTSTQ
jgi:hypothetical protein